MKEKDITIPIIPIIILVIIMVSTIFFFKMNVTAVNEKDNNIPNDTQQEENIIDETTLTTPEEVKTEQEVATYTTPDGKETYNYIGVINIPSLGIKYPILSSTSKELLKVSVTKYWGPNPHEVGNLVIAGHNYRNTKFFSKLLKIENGAKIEITDLKGKTLEYTVYDTYKVDPNNNDCTSQLTNGHTEITLITCTNDNKERFVVKARAN
ncbi:MAG: sortase [Clostridia bacterium]|nr:sortase [Clostridia bacterium]